MPKLVEQLYDRFFRPEQDEQEAVAHATARTVLDWTGQEYHGKFLKWLDTEASKPLRISKDHMDMVEVAVRANTLREIRAHLGRIEQEAQAAITAAREDADGG